MDILGAIGFYDLGLRFKRKDDARSFAELSGLGLCGVFQNFWDSH